MPKAEPRFFEAPSDRLLAGQQRKPMVIMRPATAESDDSSGILAAPTKQLVVTSSDGSETGGSLIGHQYVMRGNQLVRITTSSAGANTYSSSGTTTFVSKGPSLNYLTQLFEEPCECTFKTEEMIPKAAGGGSPVKLQIINTAGHAQRVLQPASYSCLSASGGQPIVVQQTSPTNVVPSTVLIKGAADHSNTAKASGSKVQYLRLLPPASTSQGFSVNKQTLKPIAPCIPRTLSSSGGDSQVIIQGPRDYSSQISGTNEPSPVVRTQATALVIKKYCDCFANGEFCRNCNCKDCHNNLDFEAERSKAIKASLERNPNAFRPKIGKWSMGKGRSEVDRMHQKGCHCKRSSCLKNYCECYEAKVACTVRCKCISCRNTEQDRQPKNKDKFVNTSGLLQLANVASAATAAEFCPDSPPLLSSDTPKVEPLDPKTLPWFYMTDEVIECTTLCLVAQAEEMERSMGADEEEMEKAVLKEFGRCLEQIITNASAAMPT